MKTTLITLLFFVTLGFSEPVSFYREFKASDYFETVSIYQNYLSNDTIMKQYSTGLALTVLGIGQSSTDVIFTGATYLANGLFSQLKIIRSPYSKKFSDYKKKIFEASSAEEIENLSKQALEDLIGEEQFDAKLTGGMLALNGILLLTNPDGQGQGVGFLMGLLGVAIALFEKGPLERMVNDYQILASTKETINVEKLKGLVPQ